MGITFACYEDKYCYNRKNSTVLKQKIRRCITSGRS